LVIAAQIHRLESAVDNLTNSQSSGLKRVSDEISSKLEELPNKIKTVLMENFQVEGVNPINMSDINRLITESNDRLMTRLTEIYSNNNSNSTTTAVVNANNNQNSSSNNTFQFFHWGGQLNRYVPSDFNFPKTDCKTIWDLWHFGHISLGVRPYRLLIIDKRQSDIKVDQRKYLNRANVVINKLVEIAIGKGLMNENDAIGSMTSSRSDAIFNESYLELSRVLYLNNRSPNRLNETQYSTLANRIYSASRK
jgi:hypothetical protein